MLRLGDWSRPAGESPVRVSAGAPGSRPRSRGEIPAAERGVESLFRRSKRAGCDCKSDVVAGGVGNFCIGNAAEEVQPTSTAMSWPGCVT